MKHSTFIEKANAAEGFLLKPIQLFNRPNHITN